MTQLPDTFGDTGPATQKTSGLAIASLVCSLIFFCPVTTVIAPLLGVAAIVVIGRDPSRTGRGLALAGIVLGVIITTGQVALSVATYRVAFEPMMNRPREALAAGFAGDLQQFKAKFFGAGAEATDAEAEIFIESVRTRYGEFREIEPLWGQQQPGGGKKMWYDYTATFADRSIKVRAQIVTYDDDTEQYVLKLGYVRVIDPDLGDLVYPPGAADELDEPGEHGESGESDPSGDTGDTHDAGTDTDSE